MTSNKPYFIRALYEWILDNNCTPYIVVDATLPFVEVPQQFVSEGRIILNILPSATQNLYLGDEWITFSARFSGISEEINIPIGAVVAIYAQENGEGMGFNTEALPDDYFANTELQTPSKTTSRKPSLDIVDHSSKSSETEQAHDDEPPNTKKKGTTKKPSLKIIK